jgi:hypothetical protein
VSSRVAKPVLAQRGTFGFQPVVGFCDHDPQPAVSGVPLFGLPIVGQYLIGSFAAGTGRRISPQRHLRDEIAVSLFLHTAQEGEDLVYDRRSNRAHQGICLTGNHEGNWGWFHPGSEPRFVFVSGIASARWLEQGFFDVAAEAIGPVIQFAVPDATDPLIYVSRLFRAQGSGPGGAALEGYFFHDQIYLTAGTAWTTSRYWSDIEGFWVSFVTEYEDGTVHFGHIVWSNGNFQLAVIHRSDASACLATSLAGGLTVEPAGYVSCAEFDVGDGEVWCWEPYPAGGGRIPRSLPGAPFWREGIVTRRGERRAIRFAVAWSEVFPDSMKRIHAAIEPAGSRSRQPGVQLEPHPAEDFLARLRAESRRVGTGKIR